MIMSPADFRELFPEFMDASLYTDPMVSAWMGVAESSMNANRWGDLLAIGAGLFVAHNLAISGMDIRASDTGSSPGLAVSGIVSSKSVDKVSVSYDTSGAMEAGAGHWNLTTYGTRYIRLVKLVGAGPLQIGGSSSTQYSAAAWAGPYYG